MATRSILAVPKGSTWTGTYAHWDGNPRSVIPILLTWIQRDGIEATKEFFLNKQWAELNEDPKKCRALNGRESMGLGPKDDAGAQWVYIFAPSSIFVERWEGGKWHKAGAFPYTKPASDQELTEVECGANYGWCCHYAWAHFPEAEGTKYGAAQWLGRKPPSLSCATHAIFEGKRYQLTGGGCRDGGKWWAGVKDDKGEATELAITSCEEGHRILPGVQLVFPPNAISTKEYTKDSGEILRH